MMFRSRKKTPLSSKKPILARPRLRIEELECRSLMNATSLASTFDNLQIQTDNFSDDNILVRWTNNAPNATGNSNLLDLGAGLYRVAVNPGQTVAQAVSYYQGLPGVEYATPDYEVRLARTPNDPLFSSLYGMNNTGQTGGRVDSDIDAVEAWDITTGSGNFVVAVIDTGVDYNHPDLAANMWRNTREVAGDGIDNDGNGFADDIFGYDFANNDGNPMDDNGHGTHVAGTIGAVGNNGIGVTGVNWNVKIMALKFLTASGSGNLSNAVRALNYAVQMGAKVSNNSYGGGGFFSAMNTAVSNARAAGHIFVAAAGNEANNNDVNPSYPAGYNFDNVISVAATDRSDVLASFSNFGATQVDLAAPGVNINSTWLNGTYRSISGTSMASPHVAGAVALLWDQNPSLSYSQVISQIYRTVDPVAGLAGRVATGGRLNINRALTEGVGDVSGAAITGLTFNGPNANSISSATVTFSEAINASTFTAADVNFRAPNGTTIAITGVTPVAGSTTQFTVTFATQTAPGTYTMVIGPNIADLSGNLMDQNKNGIRGEAIADQFTATRSIAAPPVTTTFTNSTALTIRDMATVTSSLTVSSSFVLGDLNVRINLNHTYDSDLVITLIAPDGTRVLLSNRRGGAGDNFTNTTFDDSATTAIANGAAPFNGVFRPDAALSVLNGKNVQGTWRLEIRDAAAQDVGTLLNWSLIATNVPSASGRGFGMESESNTVDSFAADKVENLFNPIPVSTMSTGASSTTSGVSSTPSVTWLTSSTVLNNTINSELGANLTETVSLSTSSEEGIFELSSIDEETVETESEIELPVGDEADLELMMGVELV
jgi:serine protease